MSNYTWKWSVASRRILWACEKVCKGMLVSLAICIKSKLVPKYLLPVLLIVWGIFAGALAVRSIVFEANGHVWQTRSDTVALASIR